jgi:hypothetical protein
MVKVRLADDLVAAVDVVIAGVADPVDEPGGERRSRTSLDA